MTGERVTVTIQYADGRMINMNAMMARLSEQIEMYPEFVIGEEPLSVPLRRKFYVEAEGFGSITDSYKETQEVLEGFKTASEWKCAHCGRPNKRHEETCKSCGAVRPFLYD